LKQAKDEATEEIEKYRAEREKQFKDFETKVRKRPKIPRKSFKLQIIFSTSDHAKELLTRSTLTLASRSTR
jgi:hypothetical protein